MRIALIASTLFLGISLGGCVVAPAEPAYYNGAQANVYVAPEYASPGPGWAWQRHPRYGWGWHHPEHGWHRGWR